MNKVDEPYIGYYGAANIIPARQNLDDLQKHFRRRDALYRMLGLAPGLIAGKSVLEIGPGPGDNAIHTQSLRPSKYVLIDANPASLAALREKLDGGQLDSSIVSVVEGNLVTYVPDQQFDVVLCEGLLPGQRDPQACLARIGKYVAPGGVVVATNMTTYSILSEICRRILKPFIAARAHGNQPLLDALTTFFKPDLDSLTFSSRKYEDWVYDTILHPWNRNMSFSIADAIECLMPDFEFYGSSPQFMTETRWYKQFADKQTSTSVAALAQYRRKKALLLDYRVDEINCDLDVEKLDRLIRNAIDEHYSIWDGETKKLTNFLQGISAISDLIEHALPLTSRSLKDYVKGASELAGGSTSPDFGTFVEFFGRGQQYSSFVRNR